MAAGEWFDSLLVAAALASTILLLGAVFLLILRTPRFQVSLRFLLLTVGCIAVTLGLWTAVLRGISRNHELPNGNDFPTGKEAIPEPDVPGLNRWNEPMDGPYEPKPQEPAGTPSGEGAAIPSP